jgi:hypothetical protein
MAGFKERYKVQWVSTDRNRGDGRIRTYTAQSHQGAKRAFITEMRSKVFGGATGLKGARLHVWPMGDSDNKKTMRVT